MAPVRPQLRWIEHFIPNEKDESSTLSGRTINYSPAPIHSVGLFLAGIHIRTRGFTLGLVVKFYNKPGVTHSTPQGSLFRSLSVLFSAIFNRIIARSPATRDC